MSDKAVVLVDGGYYSYVDQYLQDTRGGKIDLHLLSQELCGEFDSALLRTNFYHSYPHNEVSDDVYRRTQSFFDTIDNLPKHQFVEKGRVKDDHADCPECGKHFTKPSQKGTDVGIAVDLVQMAYKDVAQQFILITGDEDMKHAVRAAKDRLCNVNLAFVADGTHNMYVSRELTQEVDDAFRLTPEFLHRCRQQ